MCLRDGKRWLVLRLRFAGSLGLESRIPDPSHAVLLRLRHTNLDGEVGGRLEAMPSSKVGMETVCPYSRTAVRTKWAGHWNV